MDNAAAITQRAQIIRDDSNHPVGWNYVNITTDATTTIKSSAGFLHTIVINKPVASSVITIYDGTTSDSIVGTITLPATLLSDGPKTAIYDITLKKGLTIVTATGASDITVVYV